MKIDRIRKLRALLASPIVDGECGLVVRRDHLAAELDAALAAAEALARLRELLGSVDEVRLSEYAISKGRGVQVDWRVGERTKSALSRTLLESLTRALDEAEAGT